MYILSRSAVNFDGTVAGEQKVCTNEGYKFQIIIANFLKTPAKAQLFIYRRF
jgi:hypothetical protein